MSKGWVKFMLFYLIISIFVGIVLALVKTKKSHFIFGLAGLILGILILNQSYFAEKPKIENYVNQQITYKKVWFDRNENAVILESDCCKYLLSSELIRKSTSIDEITSILNKNSTVRIWFLETKNEDRKILRGLETQNFQIPITIGMTIDDPSNYASIGWLFLVLGSIIIILTFIFGDLIVSYAS